ncbi:MAG: hypothetical protein KAH20_03085 [Methylococcales bacterium]|nr:hypothetical protein [Methylococcales bacterium]
MRIITLRPSTWRTFSLIVLMVFTQAGIGVRNAEAAVGEVTSVIIDQEGWNMTVSLEGFKKQGGYFLDPNGIPKIKVKVFSEGFDSNGNPVVVERSLIVTKAVRKIYPNDLEFEETDTNTGLTVKLALNKPIYNDDKQGGVGTSGQAPIISFSSGWYQDTGPDGSSLDALETTVTAVNESNLDYPKVIGNWALPGWGIVKETVDLEAVFYHAYVKNQQPVALVEFDLTDTSGNQASSKLVNNLTISAKNDLNKVLVYSATMETEFLNSGEKLKARFRAYPWVGDEDSILDSDLGTEKPSPLYGPLYLLNDKDNLYGQSVAYVDINGDDTTGLVAEADQREIAKNAPFQTIAAAISAIATFNQDNYGRTDPSGSVVHLNNGTHNWIGSSFGQFTTGNTYLTITKSEEADKASVILSSTGTNNILRVPFVKIQDLTISRTLANATGIMFRGIEDSVLWIDQCTVEGLNHTGPSFFLYGNVYFTNNIINNAKSIFGFGVTSQVASLIRSNKINRSGRLQPYVLLGNQFVDTRVVLDGNNSNIPLFDNTVIAYNKFLDLSNFAISFASTQNIEHGFALVQNVIERSGVGPSPLLQVSGDNSLTTTNHVVMWHNTLAGERSNIFYNDVGTQPYRQQNMNVVGNIMNEFNIKSDTFLHPVEGPNAARVGNWAVLYGSGHYGNLSHTGSTSDAFQYEFFGLNSKWNIDPLFIHDASFDTGDQSGNGDYGIQVNSPADHLMNNEQVLPYDLNGIIRLNNCRGAAGAYENDLIDVFCAIPHEITTNHHGLLLSWRFPSGSLTSSYKLFRLGNGEALTVTEGNHFLDNGINILQENNIIEYVVEAYDENGVKTGQINKQFNPQGNIAPSALAGLDQNVIDNDLNGSEVVVLDGTQSVDPDGEIVEYIWLENGVVIANGISPQVNLLLGSHLITLKVIDDIGAAATDTVTINVNKPLEAKAGIDQIIVDINNDGFETVILNGSESIATGGTITAYKWFKAGNLLATGVQANIDLDVGIHQITLEVTDNNGKTATDEVTITINALEQIHSLLGEGSDQEVYSNGNKKWVGQPSARVGGALSSQDAAFVLVFKLPELGANEQITAASLDVNLLSIASTPEGGVDLYGLGFRTNPTVLASDYYQGAYGTDLTDATPLQDDFVTQTSLVGLQSIDTIGQTNLISYINAQYQSGAKGGDYLFIRLNPDVADVSSYRYWEFATANSNQAPVLKVTAGHIDSTLPQAKAGADQTIVDTDNDGVETISLNGSGSSDSDGTITTYKWFKAGVLLATGVQVNEVLPVGVHQITLEVTDNSGNKATDEVTITINQGVNSTLPQAKAGADQTIVDADNDGVETINLNGSGSSDSDGTITTYKWFKAGVLLATGVQVNEVLPVGVHQITLEVTDNSGNTATDDVIITIKTNSDQVNTLLGEISDQEVYSGGTKKWVGQSSARVGGAISSQDAAFVLVFKLPELEANEQITAATLDVDLLTIANSPEGNVDLYGLGYRNSPTVLASDYYQGAYGTDLTDATPLQDNFVTQTSLDGLQSADTTGQINLVSYINAQYQSGAKGGDYVFIRLNPDVADVSSYQYWEFSTANSNQVPVLTVTKGNVDSTQPQAEAGTNQTILDANDNGFETVTLDGSGSSDSDGTITAYKWFDNEGTLLATGVQATIVQPLGINKITLEVTDNSGKKATDEVTIIIALFIDSNIPQAFAGVPQTVIDADNNGVETITLDGSGSSHINGIITTYKWIEDGVVIATGVQANVVLSLGVHQITLEVTDNSGKIATNDVIITVIAISEQVHTLSGEISDQEVYSEGGKNWIGQSSSRVGGALSSQDAALILVYKLPELGTNEKINTATLDVNLLKIANSPEGNVDLYGLGFRDNPTVLAVDYYQGAYGADLTDATPLQDDFVTQTSLDGLQSADTTGQTNLVSYINAQYQSGAKGGDYVFIRLNPDVADVSSYHYWEFLTANSGQAPVLSVTIKPI